MELTLDFNKKIVTLNGSIKVSELLKYLVDLKLEDWEIQQAAKIEYYYYQPTEPAIKPYTSPGTSPYTPPFTITCSR